MQEPEATTESAGSPPNTTPPSRLRRGSGEILRTLIVAALIFGAVRLFVLPYEVDGASMTPSLANHERVLVNRAAYFSLDLNGLLNRLPGVERPGEWIIHPFSPPKRGDIVVLNPPLERATEPYIKRIVGLPGETVEFIDGWVYIDGMKLDEPYLGGAETTCRLSWCHEGVVPEGYVFVLGDNRENSSDSRVFGPIPIENIVGEAWFANWPIDRIGVLIATPVLP
jgi:signal peptidase I